MQKPHVFYPLYAIESICTCILFASQSAQAPWRSFFLPGTFPGNTPQMLVPSYIPVHFHHGLQRKPCQSQAPSCYPKCRIPAPLCSRQYFHANVQIHPVPGCGLCVGAVVEMPAFQVFSDNFWHRLLFSSERILTSAAVFILYCACCVPIFQPRSLINFASLFILHPGHAVEIRVDPVAPFLCVLRLVG